VNLMPPPGEEKSWMHLLYHLGFLSVWEESDGEGGTQRRVKASNRGIECLFRRELGLGDTRESDEAEVAEEARSRVGCRVS